MTRFDPRRARRLAIRLLLLAVLAAGPAFAGCGGSGGDVPAPDAPTTADFPAAKGQTIEQIFDRYQQEDGSAQRVVMVAASVFEVGRNRIPLGVFEADRTQVDDAAVALYVAKTPTAKVEGPLPARLTSLETRPAYRSRGAGGPGEATSFYLVDDVKFDRPGPWHAIALIKDEDGYVASRVSGINVGAEPNLTRPGQKAPRVATPTRGDVGGDLAKIDTRQPPSSMHDLSLDQVLGRKPVVLIFATPALCQSRVCGPVVDVAEQVKAEVGDGVAFIHNEVYNENNPNKGIRPQLEAFGLQSEPWMFLIDRQGRVVKRIEGPIGVDELRADVEQLKRD